MVGQELQHRSHTSQVLLQPTSLNPILLVVLSGSKASAWPTRSSMPRFLRAHHVLRLRICESAKDNFSRPHRPAFCTRTICSAGVFVIPGVSFKPSFSGPCLSRTNAGKRSCSKNRERLVQSDQIFDDSREVPRATTSYSINRNWTTNKAIITLSSMRIPTL
jgi:hypothetical protein